MVANFMIKFCIYQAIIQAVEAWELDLLLLRKQTWLNESFTARNQASLVMPITWDPILFGPLIESKDPYLRLRSPSTSPERKLLHDAKLRQPDIRVPSNFSSPARFTLQHTFQCFWLCLPRRSQHDKQIHSKLRASFCMPRVMGRILDWMTYLGLRLARTCRSRILRCYFCPV